MSETIAFQSDPTSPPLAHLDFTAPAGRRLRVTAYRGQATNDLRVARENPSYILVEDLGPLEATTEAIEGTPTG